MPGHDEEIAGFWVETLTAQASEEARLLAVAFASASLARLQTRTLN